MKLHNFYGKTVICVFLVSQKKNLQKKLDLFSLNVQFSTQNASNARNWNYLPFHPYSLGYHLSRRARLRPKSKPRIPPFQDRSLNRGFDFVEKLR